MCGTRLGLLLVALAPSALAGNSSSIEPLKGGSQSIDVALGTSGVGAGYLRGLSGWLEVGARADWQSWSYQDTVLIVSLGARALLRARLTPNESALRVAIEVAPGARRLTSRVRDSGCDCLVDLAPRVALQSPMAIEVVLPLSTPVLLGARSELGFDWLPGAGIVLTPQLALLGLVPLSDKIGFSVETRAGRLFALSASTRAALLGANGDAVTVPLSLQLGLTIGL